MGVVAFLVDLGIEVGPYAVKYCLSLYFTNWGIGTSRVFTSIIHDALFPFLISNLP